MKIINMICIRDGDGTFSCSSQSVGDYVEAHQLAIEKLSIKLSRDLEKLEKKYE